MPRKTAFCHRSDISEELKRVLASQSLGTPSEVKIAEKASATAG